MREGAKRGKYNQPREGERRSRLSDSEGELRG